MVVGEIDQSRRTFDPASPLLGAFCAHTGQLPGEARTLLAKFGLGAGDVLRPAGSLSPGERTRADLALLAHAGANLLVLDEPTNHLDLPAIEQLEQALGQYDGTLLLVTHDRRLLERVQVTRRLVWPMARLTEEWRLPSRTCSGAGRPWSPGSTRVAPRCRGRLPSIGTGAARRVHPRLRQAPAG